MPRPTRPPLEEPPLLAPTDRGLYCAAGDFHVDPWLPVSRAVITHGHADHARRGSQAYLSSPSGKPVLRARLGREAVLETLPWGVRRRFGEVEVSLHPAGHLLGSAQVRIERPGEVWVVSGDYKTAADATCEPFEPVPCDVFVSESTFGLPVFRWAPPPTVFASMAGWWQDNAVAGRTSLLFVYALGKAQRVLAGIAAGGADGPVAAHGAVLTCLAAYREAGVELPPVRAVSELSPAELRRALVLAPPSAQGSPWMRRFPGASTGFASGWMRLRGARRRMRVERGFTVSDHADWDDLLDAVAATGAGRVGVTHGYAEALARYLREVRGLQTFTLPTRFSGEEGAEETSFEPDADSGEDEAIGDAGEEALRVRGDRPRERGELPPERGELP